MTSDFTIEDPEYDLDVTPGVNPMNGLQAVGFARIRDVPGDDFGRMANQQHLLEAILDKLRAQEDTEGFIEKGALAALEHLDTGLSPSELYRFAQAISQVDPAQTTTCVLTGPTARSGPTSPSSSTPGTPARVAADAATTATWTVAATPEGLSPARPRGPGRSPGRGGRPAAS